MSGRGEYVTSIHGQKDPKDAIDVARREAETMPGIKVVGTARPPHRGHGDTWVVALLVEKRR